MEVGVCCFNPTLSERHSRCTADYMPAIGGYGGGRGENRVFEQHWRRSRALGLTEIIGIPDGSSLVPHCQQFVAATFVVVIENGSGDGFVSKR